MQFNSIEFLVFFPIVVFIYYLLPNRVKYVGLLAASYFFYMCWNPKYVVLILTATVITYLCGRILSLKERNPGLRKAVLGIGIGLNLLMLCFFKYIPPHVQGFDILLPVGISFYTFQTIGYMVDVYRKEVEAEKNFLKYALFVAFFPQLVAGPIERSKNLLKQVAEPHRFSYEKMVDGVLLMIWGFFLKMVIADRIAIFVDCVYGDYHTYGGWYLIVATVLFALQIYCDFYGYSVIAMGAAEILGVKLMENFRAPYLATNVAEFWRDWHISLNSWFKDYVYIPLGGNRKGKIRKYLNKMVVFLLSGVWHGSSLSFVVWGGLNGCFQIIGEALEPLRKKLCKVFCLKRESLAHRLAGILVTFCLVDFTWIFFRASRLKEAFWIIKEMFTVHNPWILADGSLYQCGLDARNWQLMWISVLILLLADIAKRRGIRIREVIQRQNAWCRIVCVVAGIMAVLIFGIYGPGYDQTGFIYFQF